MNVAPMRIIVELGTHRRLGSAYRSLRANGNGLLIYQEYVHFDIPNITNSLEGLRSELKQQLYSYDGLNEHRKLGFIKEFILSKSVK